MERRAARPAACPTLPRWLWPQSLSGDIFARRRSSRLGRAACVLLPFMLSLQRKCEAAKSIPLEMLSNQRGFPETLEPRGPHVCCECARRHALLLGQGGPSRRPPQCGAAR